MLKRFLLFALHLLLWLACSYIIVKPLTDTSWARKLLCIPLAYLTIWLYFYIVKFLLWLLGILTEFLSYEFALAIRYLHKRLVAILAITGVAVGVMVLISVTSIMSGFANEMRGKIRGTMSHINVFRGPNQFISNYQKYQEEILKIPHVTGCSPRIEWLVMFDMEKGADYCTMIGADFKTEMATSNIGDYLMDGETDYSIPGRKTVYPGLIAGCGVLDEYVASNNKQPCFKKGEEFILFTARPSNTIGGFVPQFKKFTIAGWFGSGLTDFDGHTVYVPLEAAQEFLGAKGMVTNFRISVDDYRNKETIEEVKHALAGVFKRYPWPMSVWTWEYERRNLLGAVNVEQKLNLIILFFIVIVAGFFLVAVLTMVVAEKRRDIGILLALGAPVRGVMWIFLIEGFFISALGSVIGYLFGYLITDYINNIEMFLNQLFNIEIFPRDIYLLDKIPVLREPDTMALIIGITIIGSTLFSLYPAYKAAKNTPMEALRYE